MEVSMDVIIAIILSFAAGYIAGRTFKRCTEKERIIGGGGSSGNNSRDGSKEDGNAEFKGN